jgi:multiple sugar transport system permease protein
MTTTHGAVRRASLTVAGLHLALVFLSPYHVMFFTALKPTTELRSTPPRLTPVDWQPGNFVAVVETSSSRRGFGCL